MEPEKNEAELREEDRKVRYLRLLVDLSFSRIARGEVGQEEACAIFRSIREQSLRLFPEKGDTFDLIYGARFIRLFGEVYGVGPGCAHLRGE